MLRHLSIKNYILIKELELDFSGGFTAITGETGAGKSILLGALSLILGKRADTSALQDKEQKCIIEGTFDIQNNDLQNFFDKYDLDYEPLTVFRREISKQGKSRAFINDTPVKLPLMKELGGKLVDIHSQHQGLLIGESGFQLALLDNYSGAIDLLPDYVEVFENHKELLANYEILCKKESVMREEEDYNRFQFEEISAAALNAGELEGLEEKQKVLSHAEDIKSHLLQATNILNVSDDNLINRLNNVSSLTNRVADYHKEIEELHKRIESCRIELEDIGSSLEGIESDIVFNPERLEEVNNRIDLIYNLLQKHKAENIDSLIVLQEEYENKLSSIESLSREISATKKEITISDKLLQKLAKSLHERRKSSIPKMQTEIEAILKLLGMNKAKVIISLVVLEDFGPFGTDKIEFSFSANQGSPTAPVSKIASGGELSRLMLAFKSLITQKNLLPTIILDEIDMGVSGEIAGRVGDLLDRMSDKMQLIAITHLPQIAGKATEHMKVYKNTSENRTVSAVECLSDIERINEIAAMLSNEKVSEAAKETAKELLGMNASV